MAETETLMGLAEDVKSAAWWPKGKDERGIDRGHVVVEGSTWEAAKQLAYAALLSIPWGDDQPLSREWLCRLKGWTSEANFLWFEPEELPPGAVAIRVGKNVNSDDPRISWGLTIVTHDWHMQGFIRDRGTLRRLCAAAGHTLEEGK